MHIESAIQQWTTKEELLPLQRLVEVEHDERCLPSASLDVFTTPPSTARK
jgi:hypothetical protein